MADIFSAVMMEAQSHKDYIQQLAEKRCFEALVATPNFFPETHPYPIAYEASKLVYSDLKSHIDSKSKLIQQIMDLSSEVSLTYGNDSIQQWWDFARPAQEMAWQGYSDEKYWGRPSTPVRTHLSAPSPTRLPNWSISSRIVPRI